MGIHARSDRVAEARAGEWREEWVLKIDLAKHGVGVGRGLLNRKALDPGQLRNGFGAIGRVLED